MDLKTYKLKVVLTTDSGQLITGLGKSSDAISSFASVAKKVVAGFALYKGFNFLKSAILDTSDYGKTISQLSDRLGISAERIQEYSFVAKRAGVYQETLNMGIQNAVRNFSDFGTMADEARKAISALGVSYKDQNGNLKTSEQLFDETVSKLANLKDGTERLIYSAQIFGTKVGPQFNQILAQGSDEIQRQMKLAHDYGAVVDKDFIESTKRYKEAIGSTKSILEGLRNELGSRVLPFLTNGLKTVNDWLVKNRAEIIELGKVAAKAIGETLLTSVTVAVEALSKFYELLQTARAGLAIYMGKVEGSVGVLAENLDKVASGRFLDALDPGPIVTAADRAKLLEESGIEFAASANRAEQHFENLKSLISDLSKSLSVLSTKPVGERLYPAIPDSTGNGGGQSEKETPVAGMLGPDPQEYRDLLAQYQVDHAKLMAQLTNDEDAQFAIQLEELARNYQERLGLGMEFEEASAAMSEEYATQKAERDRERELESLRDKYGRLADFLSETQSMTQIMGDTMAQTFEAVASQVGNLIADGLFGEIKDVNKAITEMFRNLLKMILQTIAQLLILKALKAAFGGPLGFLFHEGGIVGVSGMPRHHGGHAPSWMAGAPRHHTGLAPDERYAILQTREAVLNRRAVEGIGPESVAFMNRFGRLPNGGGSPTVIVNVHSADPRTWIRTEFATEYKSAKSAGYL